MEVTYTVSFADFKATIRLDRRRRLASRASFIFWQIVVPALSVFGAAAFIVFDMSKITRLAPILFGLEAGLAWAAIWCWIARLYLVRKHYRRTFSEEGRPRAITAEIHDEYILSRIPGVSEGRYFWKPEMALVADAEMVLIYVAKKRFFPIPAQALSPPQLQELVAIFQRKQASVFLC